MPHVTITLLDRKTEAPITSGAFVSVQQDKWGEGYKEQFKGKPDKDGKVEFEAQSVTKYRIVADGSQWHDAELLIDTAWDPFTPIEKFMYLEEKLIPTPTVSLSHFTRDMSIIPLLVGLIAVAIIAIAIAYVARPAIGAVKGAVDAAKSATGGGE